MVKPGAAGGDAGAVDDGLRSRRSAWFSGYWFVLALLLASYVLSAAQSTENPSILAFMIQLGTVAITLWVARVNSGLRQIGWIVIAAAGIAAVVVELVDLSGRTLDVVLSAASLIAYLVAPVAIIAHQSRKTLVDGQTLLASIAAYVMVGMFFTFLYNVISLSTDSPLFGEGQADSLASQVFFSFTTLTTTGYGNLVPESALVQSVAVIEAIAGQLFLVIAVARVVSGWQPPPR
jgi:hypothetical protein